jgi:hypothetical protein
MAGQAASEDFKAIIIETTIPTSTGASSARASRCG